MEIIRTHSESNNEPLPERLMASLLDECIVECRIENKFPRSEI